MSGKQGLSVKGSVFKRCRCRDPETGKDLGADCPRLKRQGHGSWWFRYEAPPGANGRRRQPRIGPFETQKEAEDALAVELARVAGGGPAQDRTLLVGTYLDNWLAAKKLELKPRTYQSYEEAVRLYFKPAFGHERLWDLRDSHVQPLVWEMLKINRPLPAGERPSELMWRLMEARADDERRELPPGTRRHKKSTRPLGPARIKRILAVLNAALNDAVPRKIPYNPLDTVRLPRIRQKVKPRAWTAQREAKWRADFQKQLAEARETRKATGKTRPTNLEVWRSVPRPSPVMVWLPSHTGQFLDFIEGERLYALFHLVAFTGLRRAEVIWLTWAEVDLDQGVIYIRETRADEDDHPDDPKSESGDRIVPLDALTIKVLRAWRARQDRERLTCGPAWTDSGVVFTREDGRPLSPQWVSARFEALAYEAGLPAIRFHDLRHGAASLSKAAGHDTKIISDLLGHDRQSFTDEVYTLLFPDVAQAAAEERAAIVPRRSRDG
jgi:integrase